MIKNILSISIDDAEVKRLFNKTRNITHYRRARLRANIVETLMMFHMHTDKNSHATLNAKKNVKKIFHSSIDEIYIGADFSISPDLSSVKDEKKKINLIIDEQNDEMIENDEKIFSSVNRKISNSKKRSRMSQSLNVFKKH